MKTAMKAMRACLCGLVAVLCLPTLATTTDLYYHNDLAGTPLAATDASGTLLWRQGYRPYGERLDPKAPAEQQPWFTGKAHVEAAGLSYFGARWYDPQLGRFMGVDPKGFDEANVHSFNRYAYANNNPYRYVDPDGRSPLGIFAWEAAKATGIGYGLGVVADAVSQKAAFGSVDWEMAATSSSAQAGGATGLVGGLFSGVTAAQGAVQAAKTASEIAEGTTVFRVWGGKSGPWGESWTAVNPNSVSNLRSSAGLPDVNAGRFVSEGVLKSTEGVSTRGAMVIKSGQQGGLPEVVIKNAESKIDLRRVSGVNPEF